MMRNLGRGSRIFVVVCVLALMLAPPSARAGDIPFPATAQSSENISKSGEIHNPAAMTGEESTLGASGEMHTDEMFNMEHSLVACILILMRNVLALF